jgi:hypothetical protein
MSPTTTTIRILSLTLLLLGVTAHLLSGKLLHTYFHQNSTKLDNTGSTCNDQTKGIVYMSNFYCDDNRYTIQQQQQQQQQPIWYKNQELRKLHNITAFQEIVFKKMVRLKDDKLLVSMYSFNSTNTSQGWTGIDTYNDRLQLAFMHSVHYNLDVVWAAIEILIVDKVTNNGKTDVDTTQPNGNQLHWYVSLVQISLWLLTLVDAAHQRHRMNIIVAIQRLYMYRRLIQRYASTM